MQLCNYWLRKALCNLIKMICFKIKHHSCYCFHMVGGVGKYYNDNIDLTVGVKPPTPLRELTISWIPIIFNNDLQSSSPSKQLLVPNKYLFFFFLGLNMFLIPINILTFHFSFFKFFLQLLVPIKFSITTFGPYF